MRVIPGTHNNESIGFANYKNIDGANNTFDFAIDPNSVDESKAVYFELEPNRYSLHDSRIIHGAEANTSEFRRCGYTMRYFSLDAKVYEEKNEGHKVYYVCGENVAGSELETAPVMN